MAISPPPSQAYLAQRMTANNFIALQSAQLSATTSTSQHITFTNLPKGMPVTMEISNTGTQSAYLCGSNSANIVAAVISSATPSPTSGTNAVSNAHCIPGGAIKTLDYISGTDTLSAICGTATTILEVSIGFGQ